MARASNMPTPWCIRPRQRPSPSTSFPPRLRTSNWNAKQMITRRILSGHNCSTGAANQDAFKNTLHRAGETVKTVKAALRPSFIQLKSRRVGINERISRFLNAPCAASLVAMLLSCSSLSATAGKVPAGFSERFAEGNGVRLHYFIGGKGSPVVLLHGYAETSHMWLPIMPLLAEHHTVIVPDLRGAGDSSKPESGYDKKNMALGYGTRFDVKKLKDLPPGSFYTEPSNAPHFAHTGSTPAVVQISGFGPSATHYENQTSAK